MFSIIKGIQLTKVPRFVISNRPYIIISKMSFSQTMNNNSSSNTVRKAMPPPPPVPRDSIKEIEAIFEIDDSFGDDDDHWDSQPTSITNNHLKTDEKNIEAAQMNFSDKFDDSLDEFLLKQQQLRDNDTNDEKFFSAAEEEEAIEEKQLDPTPTTNTKPINTSIITNDTSPTWHRHETWYNVKKEEQEQEQASSSFEIPTHRNRNRETIIRIPSSPPAAFHNEDPSETKTIQPPVSRLSQFIKPSEMAKNILQQKRDISTSVRRSARARNSTIELMTQKPPRRSFEQEIKPESFAMTTSKLEKNVKPIILSEEQIKVVEIAKQGQNLFYTGSAGTGKSILLKTLIRTLRNQHSFEGVGVAASTGLAACNIGGSTLHSLTGIGLGNGDVKDLIKKIKRSKKNLKRWKSLKVLIIDEISMIDGELLDKLNAIGKQLRRSNKPFGGIQLIACGDFYQLPPVAKDKEIQFAFECEAWKEAIEITIVLQKVFRQQGDHTFIDMLNDIRRGKITPETDAEFSYLSRPLPIDDDIEATELFPRRHEVEYANSAKLNKIRQPLVKFQAFDSGSIEDEAMKQRLLNNFLAPKVLHLKKGAQVMMIKNIDETLVNGSLGKVLDFIDPDTYMFYENIENCEPEKISKHIEAQKNGDNKFGKALESEYLAEEPRSDGLDESVFEFYKHIPVGEEGPQDELLIQDIERKKELINTLHKASKGRRLPLVRFVLTDGNTRDVLVEPEIFQVEDPQNEHKPLASRQQVPLILAWALSIHKSQGQTLTKVKVDLRRTFEKGQAYVALSRATSREGLQVLNFRADKIMTHEKVIEFYKQLIGVDEVDTENFKRERSNDDYDDDSMEELEATSKRRAYNFTGQADFIQLDDSDFSSNE